LDFNKRILILKMHGTNIKKIKKMFFKSFENLPGNHNTNYYDLNNALKSNTITVTVACVKLVPNTRSSGWHSVLLMGRFGFQIPTHRPVTLTIFVVS
jgi:hypothetical protein